MPTSQIDLIAQLEQIIGHYKGFAGIGLGVPGQVLTDGRVLKLPNIPKFRPTNLQKLLANKYRVPVSVINDAKAFALAQAKLGPGKKYSRVVGIILGTGIGVGLVLDGQVYPGKDGVAGEFERIPMLDGSLLRDHRRAAGNFLTVRQAKKFLQIILNMVVFSYNPDLIVLGGGWSQLPGLTKLANEITHNPSGYESQTPVIVSNLNNAGIIGAALPLLKK